MPTYQYACTECGDALEAQQSFTDEPLTSCPECSGRLRKVFSAVGVVFKGSGFYRTDSRSQPSEAASGAGADNSADTSVGKGAGKGAGKAAGEGSGSSSTPSTGSSSGSSTAAKPASTSGSAA